MLNKCPPTATQGERTFYNRVENLFAEGNGVVGYFEPDIGGLHPDFLLLSPNFGIVVVEVKDYSPNNLLTVTKSGNWEKLDGDKKLSIENPFDQIYQYWRAIKDRINYCHFPEDVQIPIIRLVVFSQISQEGDIADKIRQIAPNKVQICFKENLFRNIAFEQFLFDTLPTDFNLKEEFFQILRANLIPTCRLPATNQVKLSEYLTVENKIALLDLEQEKLARKLGEGHRLLFGVAGSGKTILLIARARYLALKHPDWKILVLCYNRLLKDLIFHLLNPQDFEADLTINTFHAWVRQYILSANNGFSYIYNEALEKAEKERKLDNFFHEVVPKLFLQMLDDLKEKRVQYDAILIDEAQDFEEDWFQGVIKVLNPSTNSLLITCDGIQGIYARKRFYWSDVGIQARGRVKKFEKSYRVPIEIGNLAQKSLPSTLRDLMDKYDEFISTKEYMGDHGIVEIIISESREEEYDKLAKKIHRLLKQPQEILVLFKYNMAKISYNHLFFKKLRKLNLEWKELKKHNYETPGLLIGTIHGTKGLECDTIVIPEVNSYLSNNDRQLLYVGITRSRKKLILSANKNTDLIDTIKPFQTLNTDLTNRT
ncbi:MAG: 3'-5' exonuclease [Candidatus Hermodarchaeota archaeon]